MKPFNLERALAGYPAVTKNGKRATVKLVEYPVLVTIEGDHKNSSELYTNDGKRFAYQDTEDDLLMQEIETVWFVRSDYKQSNLFNQRAVAETVLAEEFEGKGEILWITRERQEDFGEQIELAHKIMREDSDVSTSQAQAAKGEEP